MTYVAIIEAAALLIFALYLYAQSEHRAERRDWARERAKLVDAVAQHRPMVVSAPEPDAPEIPAYTFAPEQEPDYSYTTE